MEIPSQKLSKIFYFCLLFPLKPRPLPSNKMFFPKEEMTSCPCLEATFYNGFFFGGSSSSQRHIPTTTPGKEGRKGRNQNQPRWSHDEEESDPPHTPIENVLKAISLFWEKTQNIPKLHRQVKMFNVYAPNDGFSDFPLSMSCKTSGTQNNWMCLSLFSFLPLLLETRSGRKQEKRRRNRTKRERGRQKRTRPKEKREKKEGGREGLWVWREICNLAKQQRMA